MILDGIPDALPVQIVSTGLKDIMVPVTDPGILGRMTPDFSAITRLSLEKECIGIHAFSWQRDGSDCHM